MMVEKNEGAAGEYPRKEISHGDRRAQQKAIGQGLRKFFNAVVAEPIPDEFLILLQKMDEDRKDGAE
jgi:hypothetical protein